MGVAPTTVTRVESGAVSPSFDLAQDMLEVLGKPIGFTGQVDVAAIAAARLAVDPTLMIGLTSDIVTWQQRWARLGLLDQAGHVLPGEQAALLQRAGRTARLTRRPGAVDFQPGLTAFEIAVTLSEHGVAHAITGDAGANLYQPTAGKAWPVLYVENTEAAADAVGLTRKGSSFGRRVTLIPFDGISEIGRVSINGFTAVAPDQVLIDSYGGIDRMPEQADILMGQRAS